MQVARLVPLLGVTLLVASSGPAFPGGDEPGLPVSSLARWQNGRWQTWWRSDRAPQVWSEDQHVLTAGVAWAATAPAIEMAQLRLSGRRGAWRTRLVVVRLDPARLRLSLETGYGADGQPAWQADRVGTDVLFAVNAGQFVRTSPWGWLVLDGVERLPPGSGPLSTALTVDREGQVGWVAGDSIAARRGRGEVRFAFQSYPTLLRGGRVPEPLQRAGRGVDLAHRDARAAIGADSDGRLLVAMTRFDGLGDQLGFVPLGLTTPEMAAVMGALGAREAVALDGGISAQMLVRDAEQALVWSGLRRVPLALVARGRS